MESVTCENAECQVSLLRRERANHRCVSLWKKRAGAAEIRCNEKDVEIKQLQEKCIEEKKTTEIWRNRALASEKEKKKLRENVRTCINLLTAREKSPEITPEELVSASNIVASSSDSEDSSEVACASTSNSGGLDFQFQWKES